MRSRYVSRCKCHKSPVVIKEVGVLKKGVLDIEISVKCSDCGREYREVGSKKTRMVDSIISKEVIVIPEVKGIDNGPETPGPVDQKIESPDEQLVEKEQNDAGIKEEKEKDDPLRDKDEGIKKAEVKKKKTPKKRLFERGNKPVPERSTKEALKDNGIPKEDLW